MEYFHVLSFLSLVVAGFSPGKSASG